jgi:hypothetical protein
LRHRRIIFASLAAAAASLVAALGPPVSDRRLDNTRGSDILAQPDVVLKTVMRLFQSAQSRPDEARIGTLDMRTADAEKRRG